MGMDIPDVALVPLGEIEGLPDGLGKLKEDAFAVRHFDRPSRDRPIHIEDFAQVLGVYPAEKYDKGSYRNIAKVLWLGTGEAGVVEFIRRLVFNALIGNADMHLKNWSKFAELTLDEVLYMASRAGIPMALAKDATTKAVNRFHQVWGQERAHPPISPDLAAVALALH